MVKGSAALGIVWIGFIGTAVEKLQIEACLGTIPGRLGSVDQRTYW
jgi:hypothetical protein